MLTRTLTLVIVVRSVTTIARLMSGAGRCKNEILSLVLGWVGLVRSVRIRTHRVQVQKYMVGWSSKILGQEAKKMELFPET